MRRIRANWMPANRTICIQTTATNMFAYIEIDVIQPHTQFSFIFYLFVRTIGNAPNSEINYSICCSEMENNQNREKAKQRLKEILQPLQAKYGHLTDTEVSAQIKEVEKTRQAVLNGLTVVIEDTLVESNAD